MQTNLKTNRTPQISQAIKQKARMLTDISCRFICTVASEVPAAACGGGATRRPRRHSRAASQPVVTRQRSEKDAA